MANQVLKVARTLAALTLEDRALAISFGRELAGEKRGRRKKLAAAGIKVTKRKSKKKEDVGTEDAA